MLVGYARVSSTGQSSEVQQVALLAAGCEKVFAETRSGTAVAGRQALEDALSFVREGDVLVVTRLDRLARSASDLHGLIKALSDKGVGFRCLQQSGVDTTTSTGKLMLNMLAAIAEFETDLRKERQREGIEKAKAKGVYRGRKASIDCEEVLKLRNEGISPSVIAAKLGIGRASVYRLINSQR